MSGSTAKQARRKRNVVPLSFKHEHEATGHEIKHENDWIKARKAEYRALGKSADGRRRLSRLASVRRTRSTLSQPVTVSQQLRGE